MKKIALVIAFLFAFKAYSQKLEYTVNLFDRSDDTFKVTLKTDGLKNKIYQFASTAPGTYQVMDMGRYVHNFKAFDKKGRKIKVSHPNTNQFEISKPQKVRKITYDISETWDTPVKTHNIYMMCGSSLEDDHALLNGQTLFGYPEGLQNHPLKIKVLHPKDWTVGTALPKEDDWYLAKNYDFCVDSPILAGQLTYTSTKVKNTDIDIYTYSKTGKIDSKQLLGALSDVLNAAGEFLIKLPVKKYTFLFHFENKTAGAWEHSYSSEYIFKERDWDNKLARGISSIVAHEFFHVVTPLNIHSEIIQNFNFITPTPSQHLWLYEGTTEWASDMMQLRGGLITPEIYFEELAQKITTDAKYFDPKYSLQKMSLTSYTKEGQGQYGNIYNKGAVVAGLLDIRLLELSNGKKGLREVINEFAKKYGANQSFPEKDFFKVFVKATYPEIADFFDQYIKGTEPLPIQSYYQKLGIDYTPIDLKNNIKPSFKINPNATKEQIKLRNAWLKNF